MKIVKVIFIGLLFLVNVLVFIKQSQAVIPRGVESDVQCHCSATGRCRANASQAICAGGDNIHCSGWDDNCKAGI
jgi:hypothetical protein